MASRPPATGPKPRSGKSSTLAVLLDCINREKNYHIITIEDPIEFLHNHKSSTVHQRELHSDTPSFAHALRSALRQAPKVILVGEMRDRETIESVLEAAETGHLVLSSLNTYVDAPKTVERIVCSFPPEEQKSARDRFAKTFRYIICPARLLPKTDRSGRVPVAEILKVNARTRECIEKGDRDGKTLHRRHESRARPAGHHAALRRRYRPSSPRPRSRPRNRPLLRQQPHRPGPGTRQIIGRRLWVLEIIRNPLAWKVLPKSTHYAKFFLQPSTIPRHL